MAHLGVVQVVFLQATNLLSTCKQLLEGWGCWYLPLAALAAETSTCRCTDWFLIARRTS